MRRFAWEKVFSFQSLPPLLYLYFLYIDTAVDRAMTELNRIGYLILALQLYNKYK